MGLLMAGRCEEMAGDKGSCPSDSSGHTGSLLSKPTLGLKRSQALSSHPQLT